LSCSLRKCQTFLQFGIAVQCSYTVACLHDQNKSGCFGGLAFFQLIRAFEKFSDCFDWLDKSWPFKKAILFWSSKQANSVAVRTLESYAAGYGFKAQ